MFQESAAFIRQAYAELEKEADIPIRLQQIESEIAATGAYTHTFEELEIGARMAWRNANRCIGRLFWKTLKVLDCRHLDTAENVHAALLHHLDFATNDGQIRSVISIFPPRRPDQADSVRIWNHQLIRYAGYLQPDGSIVGDPASVDFTKQCNNLGWQGKKEAFEVLPLVIQIHEETPQWFELDKHFVLEVPLEHPDFEWFADLKLRWYAVPVISDMLLEIGGISYPAAPFNGWYMGTEIGARNLADEQRYNVLPLLAEKMGLDKSQHYTLWKDRALVELNYAVLYSYQKQGVKIVDHHTATQQFQHFERTEAKAQRPVTGDWNWLIPPLSPATTPIFHKKYHNNIIKPNFFYQPKVWETP